MRSIYGGRAPSSQNLWRSAAAGIHLAELRRMGGTPTLFLSGHWMLGHVFFLLDALLLFGGLENPLAPCFSKSMLLLAYILIILIFPQNFFFFRLFAILPPRATAERPKNSRLAPLMARLFMR